MTQTADDLVQFLHARLQEDKQLVQSATPGPWSQSGIGDYGWTVDFSRPGAGVETEDSDQGRADADFIAWNDPTRALREVNAKQELMTGFYDTVRSADGSIEGEWNCFSDMGDTLLRLLALPYADHPDYKQSWRP
jgi:hypothetical protein